MTFKSVKKALLLSPGLVVVLAAQSAVPAQSLPNPVLYLSSQEPFDQGGKQWIRYKYDVQNRAAYPAAMFAAAPALPPCDNNTKSSRTWVDVFDQRGKRLNGFCAFSKPSDLGSIWFAMGADLAPPSYIYIEMNDRQTNTRYKSNLAETTM